MVKTVQGINLESEISTVKIQLEGENIADITGILDKISSFHPIFIKEYLISSTLLAIRSKLPFLWREASETFNNLSKHEITIKEAEEYIIDFLIANRIKSMSTIPILESAHKRNIETIPLLSTILLKSYKDGYSNTYNRRYIIGAGKGNQITGSISSTKDSYVAHDIQKDKWSTNTVIQRLNLPLAKWQTLDSITELEKCWNEYSKPVVVKPTGLVGGHGVKVGINTLEEATKAFKFAKEATKKFEGKTWQTKVMIQEQVKGEDYRLLVIDGKLEAVTKRIPAFIIGNGKDSIEKLIYIENQDPRRNIKNPAHVLKPIIIDEPLRDYLDEQGLTLSSIPQKNEKVNVRKVASMSQGGITEDFTDQIGKEIKIVVESIAQSVHAFALGVDVMCLDISKPLTKDNGAILEINTMPESYLNLFPVIGKQRGYISDIYVRQLLKDNICKQFVVIGQTKDDLPTLLRNRWSIKRDDTVGEIIEDRYNINGIQINEDLEKWEAVEAIKCNASLDVIILHHRDWNDVKENGLGFDHIDTLYVTKEQSLEKENMKKMKTYKRMKLIDKIRII